MMHPGSSLDRDLGNFDRNLGNNVREVRMIWTIIQTSFRRLRNNRSELVLTFIVPIVFFSIFAIIFGSRGGKASGTPRIKIAISDSSSSPIAERAIALLAEQPSLRWIDPEDPHSQAESHSQPNSITVDRTSVEDMVRRGLVSAAIVFSPPDPSTNASQTLRVAPVSNAEHRMPRIEVLSDSFDQVASQVLTAIVQRAVMMAAAEQHKKYFAEQPSPTSLALFQSPETQTKAPQSSDTRSSNRSTQAIPVSHAMNALRAKAAIRNAPTSDQDVLPVDSTIPALQPPRTSPDSPTELLPPGYPATTEIPGRIASVPTFPEPPAIASVDVLGSRKSNPVIAMYAAGIAVMFLLFSATTASGSLLEERENSTLDRLLCSRLTMDQLLMGKWAYLTIIGATQMTLMFSWGALVFEMELARHWEGFIAMTLVTSGAAASFALFLASMCRTRTQLGWVSTIVILTMSALGGSMVPRYLMSETIQRVGLVTFNAWALEGYNKIFWRDLQLKDIELELGVLTLCAFSFIVTARMFAIRWERS